MKIYERPSVDIKFFDVEDIMATSGNFDTNNAEAFKAIDSATTVSSGVVFEW